MGKQVNIKKFITNSIRKHLTEGYVDKDGNLQDFDSKDSSGSFDFDSFPDSIKKTLDEYNIYFEPKYDWNSKADEFMGDPDGFNNFLASNKHNGFLKNIDVVIKKTTEDMILLKKREIAEAKLNAFEGLIIPSLGNEVLTRQLSDFEELVLMDPYATIEDIENGFKEAKNIIDADGSINQSKTQMSDMFTGGDISIPAFERFANDNPEYKGVYNDWKVLHDNHISLFLKELNSYRSSTPIGKIRELRNFLINFKKNRA